jgi:TIR domain
MTTHAAGVFISYRRKEGSHIAGRLYDRLVERLGEARVFMDVDSIKPGQDWTEAISHAVAQCGLMLALIGDQWGQSNASSARTSESPDYVWLEIEAAFDQDIPIIPVLLEDATMPRHADLPETLTKLTHLQAIHLRHDSFKSDVAHLLAFVQEVLGAYEKEGGPRRAHVMVKKMLDKSAVATPSSNATRLQQADDASGPSSRRGARSGPPKVPISRPGRTVARRVLIPSLLLISILVGVAAWILRPITSTSPDQASGVETAEPVNSSQDAFIEGVPDAETPPPRKPKAAGAVTGETRGLYGGTKSKTSCDAVRLVDFLETHPDKGAAWATVLGMSVDQIRPFMAQLTPVILRADTRVTNHGFVRDHATTFYSILQAGTGVFVDKHGVPAVKCFCGNPLTPARADVPHPYQGNPWPDFDSNKVIIVKPAPSAVKSFIEFDHGKLLPKSPGVKVPSPKRSVSPGAVENASPAASSVSPSAVDEGSTPAVTPSADTTTAGEDSTGPTESATTDQSNSGGSPTSEETKGTGNETESGKESPKSEETSGSIGSEENGSGKTKTGTDNSGNTGTNRDTGTNGRTGTNGGTGTNRDTGTNGRTGTNGGTGTNRDTGTNGEPGGGATGSPGTG